MIFVGFVLFLGAYLVQIGELNIGQFVASEIIVLFVVNAIEKLVSSIGICYEMITAEESGRSKNSGCDCDSLGNCFRGVTDCIK